MATGDDSGRLDLHQANSSESKNSSASIDGLKTGDAFKNNCGSDPHGTLDSTAAYCT
jgi:hypothetical protein